MSEEKKKAEAPAAAGHGDKAGDAKAEGKAGGLMSKTPVLLAGAMIIEAVVLFAGFKMLGGGAPKPAAAAELATEEAPAAETKSDEHGKAAASEHEAASSSEHGGGEHAAAKPTSAADKKKAVEIKVVDFRAPNKQAGRTYLYDVTIFAVTKGEYKERVESTLAEREALIKDRVRTIIAQCDPEKLGGGSEPGLETLRRQVKYQLDEIIGEGVIDEVLVPRCIPFRTDY